MYTRVVVITAELIAATLCFWGELLLSKAESFDLLGLRGR